MLKIFVGKGWSMVMGYGRRWTIETAFSTYKRLYGEHTLSRNIKRELKAKAYTHNTLINTKRQYNKRQTKEENRQRELGHKALGKTNQAYINAFLINITNVPKISIPSRISTKAGAVTPSNRLAKGIKIVVPRSINAGPLVLIMHSKPAVIGNKVSSDGKIICGSTRVR
jgi:hypothetical protein